MTLVYRPDGVVSQPGHRRAPGRRVLTGARIGVLDNGKPNAGLLMGTVAARLADRAGTDDPFTLLKNAAKPAPAEHFAELKRHADLAITGTAN